MELTLLHLMIAIISVHIKKESQTVELGMIKTGI